VAPAEAQPVRLEFFGDEIETMRRFDPASQRTVKSTNAAEAGRLFITRRVSFNPDLKLRISKRSSIARIYIPVLHPTPASLLDYLPREALVILDDRRRWKMQSPRLSSRQ